MIPQKQTTGGHFRPQDTFFESRFSLERFC